MGAACLLRLSIGPSSLSNLPLIFSDFPIPQFLDPISKAPVKDADQRGQPKTLNEGAFRRSRSKSSGGVPTRRLSMLTIPTRKSYHLNIMVTEVVASRLRVAAAASKHGIDEKKVY